VFLTASIQDRGGWNVSFSIEEFRVSYNLSPMVFRITFPAVQRYDISPNEAMTIYRRHVSEISGKRKLRVEALIILLPQQTLYGNP
jgi:hypothetical protein